MQKYILNILLVLFFGQISFAHEYYVSVTKGNYNADTQMMECELKITAHDFENAVRLMYAQPFNLDHKNQIDRHNQLIEKYINSRVEVSLNGQIQPIEYVGFELDATEDLWIYFQFKVPNGEFEYSNKMLTEVFAMQQNVTHFKMNTCEQSFVFTKNQTPENFICHE